MAGGVSATVDKRDIARFQRQIARAESMTTRSAEQSVLWGAINFVTSAKAATPKGKKNRDIKDNDLPDVKRTRTVRARTRKVKARSANPDALNTPAGKKERAKFLIVVRHQDISPTFIPTNQRKDKRRTIKNRGLAKASWGSMLRKLNRSPGKPQVSKARKFARVDKRKGLSPSVLLTNRVSYMQTIAPAAVSAGLRNAAKSMRAKLDKQLSKNIRGAFG